MSQIWIHLTIGGLTTALTGAAVTIGLLRQRLGRARHDADHDPTTGLPNRRAVTAHLRAALRRGTPTGVVLLDLDRFVVINETLGHAVGDLLLASVSQRLSRIVVNGAGSRAQCIALQEPDGDEVDPEARQRLLGGVDLQRRGLERRGLGEHRTGDSGVGAHGGDPQQLAKALDRG